MDKSDFTLSKGNIKMWEDCIRELFCDIKSKLEYALNELKNNQSVGKYEI